MKKLILAASLLAASGVSNAQTDPRVAQLEKRLESLEQQLSQSFGGSGRGASDGLPLHGFADVAMVSRNGASKTKGAAVGSLDFYLTPEFGDRVKSLIELVFEVEEGEGALLTDLERVQIGYTLSDAATVWLGRFHTPYGFWNTGFHHGQQIQTAANRPRFIDFEDKGGILPAHATGLWFNGALNTGAGKIGYDYYVANAPEIGEGDTAGKGVLDMKMGGKTGPYAPMNGVNLSFKPAALPDLTVGVHGLGGKIDFVDSTGAVTQTTRLRMTGAWVYFMDDRLEVIGEYYRFRNEDLTGGGTRSSSAGFVQAGYTLGAWTPFVRAEKTDLDQNDRYFSQQENGSSYKRSAAGLRYELNPKAAVKFEGSRTKFTDAGNTAPSYGEARVQLAVRF